MAYIKSVLVPSQNRSLSLIQSPTFEIEKSLAAFHREARLQIDDDISTQIKQIWLNLLSKEAVQLRHNLRQQSSDPDIKIKTYLS